MAMRISFFALNFLKFIKLSEFSKFIFDTCSVIIYHAWHKYDVSSMWIYNL